MLRRAADVKPGAALDIEFADGHVGAHADPRERKAEPARESRAPSARRKAGDACSRRLACGLRLEVMVTNETTRLGHQI